MTTRFSTCDLCDAHEAELGQSVFVLPDVFRRYGADRAFSGAVHTVKAHDGPVTLDNSHVREATSEPGQGRVLFIDGTGHTHHALLGGKLARDAVKNGWVGVVIFGAARDAAELRDADIPVRALALCPARTEKKGIGQRGVQLSIANITIHEGDWLYADEDGIVVSRTALT